MQILVEPGDEVLLADSGYPCPRFSEVLDFHAPHRVTREFDREGLAETVGATTGCAISVSTPIAQGGHLRGLLPTVAIYASGISFCDKPYCPDEALVLRQG